MGKKKKIYIHKRKFLLEGKNNIQRVKNVYKEGKKKKKNHKPIHPTDQQMKILFYFFIIKSD
jgi:DNA topoisomerase IA